MRSLFKKISLVIIALFFAFAGQAQDTAENVAMADNMRAEGKIYVVVLVMAIIFTGVATYLISIDRKLRKLENRINKK